MNAPRTGLIAGRFDPPHRGHSLLIDAARAQVTRLIIHVRDYESAQTPAIVRAGWLRELYPDVDVRVLEEPLAVDVIFDSDGDGEAPFRHFGVTGAMVRRAPLDHLEWLAPVVRAHFVKRICVTGSESTGKTTLCERLAQRFSTSWVAEYGREYTLIRARQESEEWESDEFVHIALEQQRREDEAARSANRLLFCDTDAFATEIWYERYLEHIPERWPLPASKIALYLIPYPDVPFVPDEIRDGEHMRHWMYERFIAEFERRGLPYVVLRGSYDEREAQAAAAVDSLMRDAI